MQENFEIAIENLARHGDTDIFPFPIENYVIRDCKTEICSLLDTARQNLDEFLVQNAPNHIDALVPVGYTGFRTATQQDPFWNSLFLGLTLSLRREIEHARIPLERKSVFSYRIQENITSGDIFSGDKSWPDFIQQSIDIAKSSNFIVVCDIADCYQRISHHRLENALKQLDENNLITSHLIKLLDKHSATKSFGLPVGGPASRILVELVLNMTDQLLKGRRIQFCRYADDYVMSANSFDDAYDHLIFLSEKLFRTEGLALQKSKTRIMSSSEFIATQSLLIRPDADISPDLSRLFKINLRFDPYSLSAGSDYAELKDELSRVDILGLLNQELAKTRVHLTVAKRIVSAIKFLSPAVRDNAVLTITENLDTLYPLFPVVATALKDLMPILDTDLQMQVSKSILEKVNTGSFIIRNELHAAYAVRLLGAHQTSDNQDALVTLHDRFNGPLVRRDVILIKSKWKDFAWLSDQIGSFQGKSAWERRALIIASYTMKDAGDHWRKYMKSSFSAFELIVRDWASQRVPQPKPGWVLPI